MYRYLLLFIIFGSRLLLAQEKISLENCLQQALENNPDLNISQQQADYTEQGIRAAYSGILPNIGVGLSSDHQTQGESEYYYYGQKQVQPKSSRDYYNLGLQYNQNIYDGGQWWNQIKLAKNQYEAARLDADQTRQYIIANVTEKFYILMKAQELLKVYQKSLETSEAQLNKTEEMYKIGKVAKKDLFKAQVRAGNARLQVIQQKKQIDVGKAQLNQAMGRAPHHALQVYEESYTPPQAIDRESAQNFALKNNKQLQLLRAEKQSADLNYRIARGNLFPSLTSRFSYSRGGRKFERTFSEMDKWWNTALSFNLGWSIFNGFQRKTNIEQKKIQYELYDERIRKKRLEIMNQLENLLLNLNTYREMLTINQLNITSAQEDLRLAQEMYRLNSATLLEVLDAQANLTRAESDLIFTKYDAKIAAIWLEWNMGTL